MKPRPEMPLILKTRKSNTLDRFMQYVSPEPISGCWLWTGYQHNSGYGQFTYGKNYELAHRVSYRLLVGPIPTGLTILHRCDVRLCVNPDHLFPGTDADNSKDRNSKKRHAHGERHGFAKLTEEQVKEIRRRYTGPCSRRGLPQNQRNPNSYNGLAREFNVTTPTIVQIVKGRRWSHL